MAYGSKATPAFDTQFKIGDIGFLLSEEGAGIDRMTILREPSTLVGRDTLRLKGFLGSWNDVTQIARGLGRVVSVDTETNTIRVVPVARTKVAGALEALGYPELAA